MTVVNRTSAKLEYLKNILPKITTQVYSESEVEKLLLEADVVISAVLIKGGASTPKLISKETLQKMKNGSVLVDITIDQGGISSSSRPTTHTNPIFIDEGVLHYCVANMPGAYPKTATIALTNATFKYVHKLANEGVIEAIKNDMSLGLGVNILNGAITNPAVAKIRNLKCEKLETLLG